MDLRKNGLARAGAALVVACGLAGMLSGGRCFFITGFFAADSES